MVLIDIQNVWEAEQRGQTAPPHGYLELVHESVGLLRRSEFWRHDGPRVRWGPGGMGALGAAHQNLLHNVGGGLERGGGARTWGPAEGGALTSGRSVVLLWEADLGLDFGEIWQWVTQPPSPAIEETQGRMQRPQKAQWPQMSQTAHIHIVYY